MSLSNLTNDLILDLQNGNLSRNSIIQYYNYIKKNIEEVNNFTSYRDYKHSALILGILLEVEGYLTDPDERQAVVTLAYYTITKGLFNEIYDEERVGITDRNKSLELTELLGARLSIINDAEQSLKYSLNSSDTIPIDDSWSPFSSSQPADKILTNMKTYDAYLIDDRSRGVSGAFINPEIISISKQVLQYCNHYSGAELNSMMMMGYKNHKDFFEYLEDRFENEKDFDFS